MTPRFPKKTKLGLVAAGISALLLVSLTGCEKKKDPISSGDPCVDSPSLCVPRAMLKDTGEVLFTENCGGCHGSLGNGDGHGAPRVANSDFFMNNRTRVISILLRGNQDTLHVNGECRNGGGMSAGGGNEDIKNSNFRIASILTWLRSVRNDSTVSNCTAPGVCTKVARNPTEMDLDTVAVWEVKAVRDTLHDYPNGYVGATCPE
jgi:hypothetical protein